MRDVEDAEILDFSVSASGVVCQKPCWLYSVTLSGYASGSNVIQLYDAQAAVGDARLGLRAAQYTSTPVIFNQPMLFNKGLWVEIAAGTCNVCGQYRVIGK